MAEVKAQLNGLRIAPRKVRAVANLVKGKDVTQALNQMEYLIKRSAPSLIKLLNSAVANAENNFHMVKENLYIKDFAVDEGMKLKRFRPKAQGRAGEIQKKTSRIRLILGEKVAGLKKEKKAVVKEKETLKTEIKEDRNDVKKPEIKTELGKKGDSTLGNLKRIFRRKAI